MLGGLYGDLPAAKNANEENASAEKASRPEGWSSGVKAMIPPPRAKNTLVSPPPSVLRAQALGKPKPSPRPADTLAAKNRVSEERPVVQVSTPTYVGASLKTELADEYDPARPNDYEEHCRERIRQKREKEVLEQREKQRKEMERERQEREEAQRSRPTGFDQRSNSLNVSGEEAFLRRGRMGGRPPSPPSAGPESSASVQDGGGLTAAQRMMQKMGWREGSGLGRAEQGMTTPLIAKKTEGRAGVVVQGAQNSDSSLIQDAKKQKMGPAAPQQAATRILLLRNMVGPGEVDDDLEDEVAEECAGKYGAVRMVKIFEVTEPNWPVHEAVRIFVEFEREESSMKGMIDLDGRFFGGRVVHASFFSVDRFENNVLAPLPGEVQL